MKYLSILSFFIYLYYLYVPNHVSSLITPMTFLLFHFQSIIHFQFFTHNWFNFFFLLERHQNDVENLTLLNKGEILKSKKYIVILHFTYKCKIPQIIHGSSCKAIFRFGFLSNTLLIIHTTQDMHQIMLRTCYIKDKVGHLLSELRFDPHSTPCKYQQVQNNLEIFLAIYVSSTYFTICIQVHIYFEFKICKCFENALKVT